MRVGAVLVQGPGRHVAPRPDGHVADDGDPHVRVRLQAEGEDRDADEEDGDDADELGGHRGVGLVKHQPDLGLGPLPPAHAAAVVVVLVAEPLGDLLVARLLGVEVQGVEDGEGLLGVPVLGVGHPAARLNLLDIDNNNYKSS